VTLVCSTDAPARCPAEERSQYQRDNYLGEEGYCANEVTGASTHRGDQVLAGWLCRPRFGPQVTN